MPSAGEPPHPFPRTVSPGECERIRADELRRYLAGSDRPLLLDVRPTAERTYARIEGDRAIPLAELPSRLEELPKDRRIVAYGHYGEEGASAAKLLCASGFPRSASLEGGIEEYARLVAPEVGRYAPPDAPDGLLLLQLPRLETGCLAYLLADVDEKVAVMLDPGAEPEPYLALLADRGWRLGAIVETHTHADHRAGHAALAARTGAPIYLSHRSPAQYPHRGLTEGEELRFGSHALRVLETPGHTRDHLSLRSAGRVFTGDTLLIGSCGRTDLADGDPELLWESLRTKLLALPDATEVLPAHFGARHALVDRYVSSIGLERRTNEALLLPTREGFLAYMREGWPPKPAEFDRIVGENLAG
ncbi:MAG: MBL fold metallo-hydrolase [Thermoplasmata archaeon]|nr:MBL fold metallo-hydrolase [Thermoplasmata archaeon]